MTCLDVVIALFNSVSLEEGNLLLLHRVGVQLTMTMNRGLDVTETHDKLHGFLLQYISPVIQRGNEDQHSNRNEHKSSDHPTTPRPSEQGVAEQICSDSVAAAAIFSDAGVVVLTHVQQAQNVSGEGGVPHAGILRSPLPLVGDGAAVVGETVQRD